MSKDMRMTWGDLEWFANGKGRMSGETVYMEARKLAVCDVCFATDGYQKQFCRQDHVNCDFNPCHEPNREIA